MNVLDQLLAQLPEGATITRRAHSWVVETPERKGYLSCGSTPTLALSHCLKGAAKAELDALEGLAK